MSHEAFQAPSPESLAALLPQFDIEFFIAQGGMGAVYKGRQRSLDRDIAIKVLPKEVGESEEFRDSFISEAKSMARLNHSNLLGVFDYGTVDGMPYIVMEYVSGGSLHQAAYNQAVELMQAAIIVKGICSGLAHAHEHGIIHRDIKPSNILLTQKLEPKVADFGLAHAADSDMPGLMMGTPGYTAPEVFQDPSQAGMLADIYSVGVILHQLLSGIDPAGCMGPPTQPSGSLRLDAIWRKATNINPALRYPTVVAMEADLDKWIASKQTAAAAVPVSPYLPRRTAQMQTASGGGGLMGKLVIIGILVPLVFFAYQKLQERKAKIAEGITDSAADASSAPASQPEPAPETTPGSVPLTTGGDKPTFETEPIEIGANEKPETVGTEDDEPEEHEELDSEPSGRLEPGDPLLLERAIGLIGDARKIRDKELSDNASTLRFNLSALSRDAESYVLSRLDRLKDDIVDNRIPQIDRVSGLPVKMKDAFKDALSKEESIDEKYRTDLTRIRDAYGTRLKGAAAEATDEDLKKRLLAQSTEAEDLDAWIQLLAPERKRAVKSSGGGAESFVGNWDVHAGGNVERWIGHQDGSVEVVGEKWKVTWVIMEDGTLEVRWDGKKPYMMKQADEGWVGKSSYGHPVEFKQGDW